MVAPDGEHNIAMTCACLVFGWLLPLIATDVDAAARGRRITLRGAALRVPDSHLLLCFGLGPASFDALRFLDLDLIMGSSSNNAAPSAALPQPRSSSTASGADPVGVQSAPCRDSNAPIGPRCQSFLAASSR